MSGSQADSSVNVAIFAGGRSPHDETILQIAQEWCSVLANQPNVFVLYGGGDTGVMKIVADSTPPSQLVSIYSHQVSDKVLSSCPIVRANEKDENQIFLATTAERKQRLVRDADFVLCFPGGLGTLDELFTTFEQKKEGGLPRLRSIFLVGWPFCDRVEQLLTSCVGANFIQPKHIAIIKFRATVEDLRRELSAAQAESQLSHQISPTFQAAPAVAPRARSCSPPLRVTVIIPTIGRSTLKRALSSAADSAQYVMERLPYPSASLHIDFVVCVDCQAFNNLHLTAVLEMTRQVSWIKGGPRILFNNRTPGLAGTMNTALMALVDTTGAPVAASNGDTLTKRTEPELHYIAVLDDDDEWEKPYLHRILLKIISAVCGTSSNENGTNHRPLWLTTGIVRRSNATASREADKVLQPRHEDVNVDSFLVGNPGIQGSNTFVEFGLMLKAGLYDERLSSATDRDLCLRLLLLLTSGGKQQHPKIITIVDEPLVIHHADVTDCSRLSNPQNPAKLNGLAMFWAKWQKLMTKDTEDAFFHRCRRIFEFSNEQIVDAAWKLLPQATPQNRLIDSREIENLRRTEDNTHQKQPRLVVLFASHDQSNVNAMLSNLAECNKALVDGGGTESHVIVLLNGGHVKKDRLVVPDEMILMCVDRDLAREVLAAATCEAHQLQGDESDPITSAGTAGAAAQEKVKKFEIAESRCILHHIAHIQQSHYDRFLFLDDDKMLDPLFLRRCVNLPADLCDVGIGSDNFAPPVPSMSTWRCQLISYMNALLAASSTAPPNSSAELSRSGPPPLKASIDSYYDQSRSFFNHLEFETFQVAAGGSAPLTFNDAAGVGDILANIVCGVPCFANREADASVLPDGPTIERGGCCLVLNAAYLLPFPTPSLAGHPTRRSDFVWASLARKKGASILRLAVLAVKHQRHAGKVLTTASDLFSTLLKDTIGSVIYQFCDKDDAQSVSLGQMRLTSRVQQVVASCHRVAGCLDIIEGIIESSAILNNNRRGLESIAIMRDAIGKVFSFDWSALKMASSVESPSTATNFPVDLIKAIKIKWAVAFLPRRKAPDGGSLVDCDYDYIGGGCEGRVFYDKLSGLAFKVFYRSAGWVSQCLQLVEPQLRICNSHTISYPFVSGKPYRGGYGTALFRLACQLRKLFQEHQIVFWDVKPQNLILSKFGDREKLSIVDYGKDWKAEQTVECFEGSLRRLWACFLFGRWEDECLREMLRRCRKEKDPPLEFGSGYINFRAALAGETSDAGYGPDEAISHWISTKIEALTMVDTAAQPIQVLDYGCGNAKLVQEWAQKFPSVKFTAFDPEGPAVWGKHADSLRVRFVTNVGELRREKEQQRTTDDADFSSAGYDLIVLSRVLCVIEDDADALAVLSQVQSLLKVDSMSSVAVITCLSTTHTRHMCCCPSPIARSKVGYPSGQLRTDFQRTFHHLKRLCAHTQLTTLTSSDFLFAMDLNEFQNAPMLLAMMLAAPPPRVRLTTTLLVRCCDQDAQFLYNQLTHVTNVLQQRTQFDRVLLLVDVPNARRRPREFSQGDPDLLQHVVTRLVAEHVVDEVLSPTMSDIREVISALFPEMTTAGYDDISAHHSDGVPFGSSLYALLRRVTTDLVLHMDCDMLLLSPGGAEDDDKNSTRMTPGLQHDDPIHFASATFQKNPLAWTLSLPFVNTHPAECYGGNNTNFRLEVRGGWLRRSHVERVLLDLHRLPDVKGWKEFLCTHWYRWLDRMMATTTTCDQQGVFQSLRYAAGPRFGMIHVPNSMKSEPYRHHLLLRQVVDGLVCVEKQAEKADVYLPAFHHPLHLCDIVIVVCGKNVAGGVAARCSSGIVAACDALYLEPSSLGVHVGVALILDDTPYDDCIVTRNIFRRSFNTCHAASELKQPRPKIVLETLTPETRQGCLANLHFAVEQLCQDNNTVIVTCDLDDELLQDALVNVWNVFGLNKGMLLAAGGAVRTYKGGLAKSSLEQVAILSEQRDGSDKSENFSSSLSTCHMLPHRRVVSHACYAHLRAFRRGHFLRPEVVRCFRQSNEAYWDLANDWAFMLPMALVANAESSRSSSSSPPHDEKIHNFSSAMLLYDRRTVVDSEAREAAIARIVQWVCQHL